MTGKTLKDIAIIWGILYTCIILTMSYMDISRELTRIKASIEQIANNKKNGCYIIPYNNGNLMYTEDEHTITIEEKK